MRVRHVYQANLRRNRIFRDRSNPLEVFDDEQLFRKFRFDRQEIFGLTDSVNEDIEVANRMGPIEWGH